MTMHIFHWMIVVRNGQVFNNFHKVFGYLNTDINCRIWKSMF